MPRKPREEVAGGVHHVYARGNDRRRIFLDEQDRHAYLRMLGWVVTEQRWHCLAYCLMDNHIHLLIETPAPDLAIGMRNLHGLYAQDFNVRHGRSGHLFQGRYGSKPMSSDEHLGAAVAYIARNPAAAGLCRHPDDWRWSSHGAWVTNQAPAWLDVDNLLSRLAALGGDPRRRYAELVGAGVSPGLRPARGSAATGRPRASARSASRPRA